MADYLHLIDRHTPGRCDVTPVFANGVAFRSLIADLAAPYRDSRVECVVGIDALGFVLASALALELGAGFVPVRKGGKLPGKRSSVMFVDYTGQPKALELNTAAIAPGTRVLIADEWVETGAQMLAAAQLVERSGGAIVGICTIYIDDNVQTKALRSKYSCHSLL